MKLVAPGVWLEVPRQVTLGVAIDTTCYPRCCTLNAYGTLNIVAFNFVTLGGGGGHVLLSLLWPAGQEGQSPLEHTHLGVREAGLHAKEGNHGEGRLGVQSGRGRTWCDH